MSENMDYKGLTGQQVIESREKYGANILTPPPSVSLWVKFFSRFKDPLIIILLVACILSVGISCYEYWGLGKGFAVFFEPLGILIAILLATGMSFYFENKADNEFRILNQVNDDELVKVIRDGHPAEIPKRDVVVGDIVILNTGDEIPADGQLLEAGTLSVDESSLTGEPVAEKSVDPARFDKDATYPTDYLLRGTKVMEGHGVYRVDKVGDATENGKVMVESRIDDSVKTPLDEQLDRLGKVVSVGSYLIAALIVVGRCIMYFTHLAGPFEFVDFITYFLQTLMIAVTLIVVAVPEGLPMAVTMSLALSMRRMLRTNNLVRKLHACETMGATTVICTDKTGTLTQNRMQVGDSFFPGKVDEKIIDEGIAVNSTAQLDLSGDTPKTIGNPTEGALLLWLHSRGIDYNALKREAKVVAELPFSTERKYMATIVKSPVTGELTLYVKGAPEIVLAMCSSVSGDVPREEIEKRLLAYQEQAMRTMGFAYATLRSADDVIADNAVHASNLVFLGIVAISDPVREDVPAAVKECTDAGIAIKIVTGDTPATAREIGRRISLWNDTDTDRNIITGPQFAALTDEELDDRVMDLKIIARARPGDKKRLVEALQKKNQVVAVTGDGTNDAPALKAAHVGLSMGDGTAVAKEASDITIVDNSFASIGRAVMWGRSLYKNIQRFILFQLTVNVAACLTVLAGAFMGTESPLTVTQMLWVNLIMDTFAAMAMASLPPSESVMKDKPRNRRDFIINRPMWRSIFGVGGVFFLVLFGLLYVFEHADIQSFPDLLHPQFGDTSGLTPKELSMFFTFFVFLQFWNLFNVRSFGSKGNPFANLSDSRGFDTIALFIFIGQILIVSVGGQFFNVVPLSFVDWISIIAVTSLVLWIDLLMRVFKRKA